MAIDQIPVNTSERHADKSFPSDWMAVQSGDETLVVNEAGDSGTTVYSVEDSTRNPRVVANADAVVWEGIVGLTDFVGGFVTISHRFAGTKERLLPGELLDEPVLLLERTQLVNLAASENNNSADKS